MDKKSVKVSGKKSILINYIYIHIPFCLQKCSYCSFYSEKYTLELKNKFVSYLIEEVSLFKKRFKIKPLTIYFGGGTPSLLDVSDIHKIISQFDLAQIQEITLELNPINITTEFVQKLPETPINRISMGAQSFIDSELNLLGRLHNSEQISRAFELLRNQGFENISLDLIYGLPNQKMQDVLFSLDRIIELNPEHVSLYCLSLEENIPLYSEKHLIPEDEVISDIYDLMRTRLISSGFEQYEISNFAKKGFESKHNLCYWSDKYYLGFGPSAAGYLKNFRYTNPADLEEYFETIKTSQIFGNLVSLSNEDHEKEFIFLSLRKTKGMNLKEFRIKFQKEFLKKYLKTIDKYLEDNFLEIEGEFIKLTPEAYFISNEIFLEFM
ncbi:MAG: radical SAM family heme chaperone HemW [Armatimonadetes bacterium]|nr:radical SAM family heme chaperone HemW [Armatimonadota bacterium]